MSENIASPKDEPDFDQLEARLIAELRRQEDGFLGPYIAVGGNDPHVVRIDGLVNIRKLLKAILK